jgi:endonuclease YncB( thermonuclease family)
VIRQGVWRCGLLGEAQKIGTASLSLTALVLCAAAPLSREPITGLATITDGDTLRIERERIRFFGIDAPEMRQSCNDDLGKRYPCGEAGRERAARPCGPCAGYLRLSPGAVRKTPARIRSSISRTII